MSHHEKHSGKALRTFATINVRKFFIIFLLLFNGFRVIAQPGSIDLSFNPTDLGFGFGDNLNGSVQSILLQSDGKILLGGAFTSYFGKSCNYIVRLNSDGSPDDTFDPGIGANGSIRSMRLQSDGKILVVGEFRGFNGEGRNGIARLHANGSLDVTFNPGSGADQLVQCLAVQSDGKILIGGNFTNFNGAIRRRIARLNTNGTLDSSFNPSPINIDTAYRSRPFPFLRSLAIQSDGKILIGGEFDELNKTTRNCIARLNVDGSLDSTFDPGTGANMPVNSIIVQNNGKILISGNFTNYNGTTRNHIARLNSEGSLDASFNPGSGADAFTFLFPSQTDGKFFIAGAFTVYNGKSRNRIARLNADGSLDETFDPGSGADDTVYSLALQPDGRVFAGGEFSTYEGMERNHFARLKTDGSLDNSFFPLGTGASNQIRTVVAQNNGKVLIGGDFTRYNGKIRNRIARLNEDGTLDASLNPGTGANSSVNFISMQADGKILVGGSFTSFNGIARNRIARLNEDGSLDASFNPGTGTDGQIKFIAVQSDGKILIAGDFSSYNGTAFNRVARLNTNGSIDITFQPGSWTGPNSFVSSLAIQTDGRILIGGEFRAMNRIRIIGVARLRVDGSRDEAFDSVTRFDTLPVISSLAIQSDGKVIIGMLRNNDNNISLRNGIARLNGDGSLDSTFNPGVGVEGVTSIAVQPDGKILIGGSFTSYNGTPRNRIARLKVDGSLDSSFKPGAGANGSIFSLAIQMDNKILIAGNFTGYDGVGRNRVARLLLEGVCSNPVSGGRIDTLQTGTSPFDPVSFTATSDPSGHSGTLQYKWQSSSTGSSGVFTDIGGATAATYDAGALTQTMWFRRLARVTCQDDWVGAAQSNVLEVRIIIPCVNPTFGGTITASQSGIGPFNPVSFTSSAAPSGHLGTLQYQWQSSTTGISGVFTDISGATDATCNAGVLTQTTWFRRLARVSCQDDWAGAAQSNLLEVSVSSIHRQSGAIDLSFNPMDQGLSDVLNNFIRRLAIQLDGKILMSGAFTSFNGITRNRIARLNVDGTLDTSFDPKSGANSNVSSIAIQSDGKILMGGGFTIYNGITCNRIARLYTDGTLDASFDFGEGANGGVSSIALQSDGKILIGGQFTSYNGITRNRIARLNNDGTLDASFDPGGGANSWVYSIVVQSDGKILMGGAFTSYNGVTRNRIARLNTDGTLDASFDSESGANDFVESIVVQSDGMVLIGGNFKSYNGISRNRIARLNTDGTLDASFDPQVGADGLVRSLLLQSDGRILVGGDFTSYNGIARNRIAKLNVDGSLDTSFDPGIGTNAAIASIVVQPDGNILIGGSFSSYDDRPRNRIARLIADGSLDNTVFIPLGLGASSNVSPLALQPDGKILMGGDFTSFNGTSRIRIARLNTDGTVDASFDPGSGADNLVWSIALQSDGKILIGGYFSSYNGTKRNRIARLNADGTLDASFDPGSGANRIESIAVQSDGKILIGGTFTSYNGIARNRIARLNADGTLDASFDPGSGANSWVYSIAVQSDGKILIGGSFTSYNGVTRNRIARLNINGSLDGTFDPGTGANGLIHRLEVQLDGKILIGGDFTSYNGIGRNYIAWLNADGTLHASFDTGSGANNPVRSIAIQSDGKIMIAGNFTSYNGTTRNRIARLNADGTLDATFDPGGGANGTINSIALQPDGNILIGGDFTNYDGTGKNRVARILGSPPVKTWIGGTGNWNVAANWSGGTVPVTTDVITVTTGNPKLNTDFTVAGSLTLSGTGSLTVEPSRTLTVSGAADFGGKPVTFRSDATGTAQLGTLTGTLTGAGNVTVERFIPATGRRWRLLTAPLTGLSINAAWQKGQTWNGTSALTSDGTGTLITGQQPGSASNANAKGFDFWSGVSNSSTSIMTFTQRPGQGIWTALANTTTANAFDNGQSYLLFVRGPRGSGFSTGTANAATTLRPTGTLRQGDVNMPVDGSKGYTVVGNPYASQIDFNSLYMNSGNSSVIKRQFWMWDATAGTSGNWQAVVYSVDRYVEVPRKFHTAGQATPLTAIQSGHGFMVTPSTHSGGTMKIRESNKVATAAASPNILLSEDRTLRVFVNLMKQGDTGDRLLTDGVMIAYGQSYHMEATDAEDALKLDNSEENLAVSQGGAMVSADARPVSDMGGPIDLRLWNLRAGVYRFEVKTENMETGGWKAYLEDSVGGSRAPLAVNGEVSSAEFTVGADAASRSERRFRIVFEKAAVNASMMQEPGNGNGRTLSVYPNPVTGRTLTVRLRQVPKGIYSLQLLGSDGRLVTDRRIEHDGGSGSYRMELGGMFPRGIYQVRCLSGERSIGSEKLVVQ